MVARYSFRELEVTSWKVFLDLIPRDMIAEVTKRPMYVRLHNGSCAHGWNLQNDQTMKSLNLSWFWMDEVCEDGLDERVYYQAAGRLRNPIGPRKGWVTGNPAGKNWVWKLFHSDKPKANHVGFVAATEENIYLPSDYLKNLRQLYDDEMLAKYLAGSFEVMEGMVFDNFDQSVHLVDPFRVPAEWPKFRGIDHGFTNPTACLWMAADFTGNLFVYRNYYQRQSIPSENVKAINDLTGNEMIDWTVIDPSVKQTESSGERIVDQYRKAGLICQYGDNDVKASISRIRGLLHKDEAHPFPAQHHLSREMGSPKLFITRDCRELIWEMQQYQWKQIKPGRVDKEVPLAKHDHAIAALRYMVMRSPRQAVEQPSVSQYDRFMQIAKEIEGISETEEGIIPMEDIIGNQAI